MTAPQSLSHPWLRRKPSKKQSAPAKLNVPSELDLAKDNLRCFVERWSEHPNSPYLFDTSYHTISPCVSATHIPGMRSRAPSLSANSPSPCGSIASIPDADLSLPPSPADKSFLNRLSVFDRRASDSTCFVRHCSNDSASRINLAEEIKKLSDKLIKFNHSNDSLNNNQFSLPSDNYFYSSSVSAQSTVFDDQDLMPRRKFKFSGHNRDIPLASSPCWSRNSSSTLSSCSSSQSAPQSPGHSPEPPDMTKDLLKMLNKYENFGASNDRHRNSLSVEWTGVQTLGQRTMRSLTNYIQSSRGSVVEKKKSRFAAP